VIVFRILVVIVPNYCERDFNKSAEEHLSSLGVPIPKEPASQRAFGFQDPAVQQNMVEPERRSREFHCGASALSAGIFTDVLTIGNTHTIFS